MRDTETLQAGEYSQGGGKLQVRLRSGSRGLVQRGPCRAVVSGEPRQVAVPEDTGGRSRAGSEEGEETGSFQSPSLW